MVTQASRSGLLLWDQSSLLSAVKVAVCPQLSWAPSRKLMMVAMQARGITVPCHDAIPFSKEGEAVPVHQFWAALCNAGGPDQVWHRSIVCTNAASLQPGSWSGIHSLKAGLCGQSIVSLLLPAGMSHIAGAQGVAS
jgi:hypothetical protein